MVSTLGLMPPIALSSIVVRLTIDSSRASILVSELNVRAPHSVGNCCSTFRGSGCRWSRSRVLRSSCPAWLRRRADVARGNADAVADRFLAEFVGAGELPRPAGEFALVASGVIPSAPANTVPAYGSAVPWWSEPAEFVFPIPKGFGGTGV